ncbi:conjugal transfer protein [Nesterenkonia sp. CF4.4]|uniref:conjugal transfer protein n=1 Tax=Nesterenkonia sp. CF4.4 TaxID=3373079 RepID=UPI003EE57836
MSRDKRTRKSSTPETGRKNKRLNSRKSKKAQRRDESVTGTGTTLMESAPKAGIAAAWLLVAFMFAGAVVAFGSMLLGDSGEEVVAQESYDVQAQQAGTYAQEYVAAWLRSTRDDSEDLAGFGREQINADTETAYRDLAVASVEDHDNQTFTALIAASVRYDPAGTDDSDEDETGGAETASSSEPEPEPDPDPEPEEEELERVWQRSWYQVTIAVDPEGDLTAVGWPTPIASPTAGQDVETGYSEDVDDDALTEQISGFLSAYAAYGDEDQANPLSLYAHPDTDIEPIEPAPYDEISVTAVRATEEVPEEPDNGDQVQVEADVDLTTADGARPGTYYLSLSVRGGRWEITSIDASPQLAEIEDQPAFETEDPSESDDPEENEE